MITEYLITALQTVVRFRTFLLSFEIIVYLHNPLVSKNNESA